MPVTISFVRWEHGRLSRLHSHDLPLGFANRYQPLRQMRLGKELVHTQPTAGLPVMAGAGAHGPAGWGTIAVANFASHVSRRAASPDRSRRQVCQPRPQPLGSSFTSIGARSALIVIGHRAIRATGEPGPVKRLEPLVRRHVAGQDLGHGDRRRIEERQGRCRGLIPISSIEAGQSGQTLRYSYRERRNLRNWKAPVRGPTQLPKENTIIASPHANANDFTFVFMGNLPSISFLISPMPGRV